ncbi:MAG: DUF86 domain-containing protein [Armatimonadetes bacterium]|nr:DUF86 domain-containing protein [Armatimonadota bacterium]
MQDILDRASAIRQSTEGTSFAEFAGDADMRDANTHRVMLIGEAANSIPEAIRDRHPEIPWRRIRDMRNVLVHIYFAVRVARVWETIERDVPELARQMRELLAAEAGTDEQ